MAQVDGVIKKENGYRFSKEFIESLDSKFLLFELGIVRFDKRKFNSYYIMCLDEKAQWGLAKFNKDKSFNSVYVEEEEGIENRYDSADRIVCKYLRKENVYTKSTDGSKYVTGGKEGFESGDKKYYYIR